MCDGTPIYGCNKLITTQLTRAHIARIILRWPYGLTKLSAPLTTILNDESIEGVIVALNLSVLDVFIFCSEFSSFSHSGSWKESQHFEFHTKHFPLDQGTNVRPSNLLTLLRSAELQDLLVFSANWIFGTVSKIWDHCGGSVNFLQMLFMLQCDQSSS